MTCVVQNETCISIQLRTFSTHSPQSRQFNCSSCKYKKTYTTWKKGKKCFNILLIISISKDVPKIYHPIGFLFLFHLFFLFFSSLSVFKGWTLKTHSSGKYFRQIHDDDVHVVLDYSASLIHSAMHADEWRTFF